MPLTADGSCAGEAVAFDTPVQGTLPGGWDAAIGDWLSDAQVACTPFPSEFPAPYSVTRIAMPPDTTWAIAALPDDVVDLTLAAWFQATDDGCYPERDVPTPRCVSASSAEAGQPEQVELMTAANGFEVVIAVGLAPDSPAGGYKLIVRNP